MTFRKDINGLRAIAVIVVVLFHFNPSWVPGGFIGVDVFFVISGFLMTGIIFKGLENDSFSLFEFYLSRAKRIIPALLGLCLSLIIFGWFFLIPLEYGEIGKHVASSISFLSNVTYLHESGYFDKASHEKWLLHTWSLSVEWQFYIIYPLILIVMKKFINHRMLVLTVVISAIVTFVYSVITTYQSPEYAYFMLPTRAWEMLVGGVAFLLPIKLKPQNKVIWEIIGILLIIISCLTISSNDPWPGSYALMPVLGAFLVIQAKQENSKFTGNIVFQKIGFWSYSIYLWHWPVVVLNLKFNLNFTIWQFVAIVLALSLCSFYLIERRFSFKVLFSTASLILCLSIVVYHSNGLDFRFSDDLKITAKEYHNKYYGGSGYDAYKFIYINGDENNFDMIFTGDSYGLQYSKVLDEHNYSVAGLFNHSCLIFPNYTYLRKGKEDKQCASQYEKLHKVLADNPDKPLFIAQYWDAYTNHIIKKNNKEKELLTQHEYFELIQSEVENILSENGAKRNYYLVGVPQKANMSAFDCLARDELIGFRYLDSCNEKQERQPREVNTVLENLAQKHSNVTFINPDNALCEKKSCYIIKNNTPIHSDRHHLSVYGANIALSEIMAVANL